MNFSEISWDVLRDRQKQFSDQLASGSCDPQELRKLQKDLSAVTKLINAYDLFVKIEHDRAGIQAQMLETQDAEMQELFEQEMQDLNKAHQKAYSVLDMLIYPPDEIDNRSVFLEIRAGTGGQEASLFAGDLLRMYTLYAQRKGWKTEISSSSETDLGGYREVVVHIKGENAYGQLKHESGVHRVQRVPATETSGRVHTSTATVAVLPEAEEVDVVINPADLRIDVYRASGAGGQHVNKTDSAVRITHIPTGVAVACQEDRSQHKNKAKAMKVLQSRLLLAQREQEAAERSKQRKEQIGTGTRSEKVRTYNYPQNRISDHQVDLTLKKLDIVMEGELDEIIEALVKKDLAERRKQIAS